MPPAKVRKPDVICRMVGCDCVFLVFYWCLTFRKLIQLNSTMVVPLISQPMNTCMSFLRVGSMHIGSMLGDEELFDINQRLPQSSSNFSTRGFQGLSSTLVPQLCFVQPAAEPPRWLSRLTQMCIVIFRVSLIHGLDGVSAAKVSLKGAEFDVVFGSSRPSSEMFAQLV